MTVSDSDPIPAPGRVSPSAITALADVATYLQAGLGSDEVLSGVVGALRRDLDLRECRIWLKDRAGTGYRAIGVGGVESPDAQVAERAREWINAPSAGGGDDKLHLRFRLSSDGHAIGMLDAVTQDEALVDVERRILSIAANILAPWLASIELSEDLAAEVAYRTRETEAQRRFISKVVDSLPVGLYVVDRDYRTQAWNTKREIGERGVSRDDVLGREVFEV